MKMTEEQILEKARSVMKNLDGKFYFEGCIDTVTFKKDKKLFQEKMKVK